MKKKYLTVILAFFTLLFAEGTTQNSGTQTHEAGTETNTETNKTVGNETEKVTGNENTTETLTGKNSGQSFSRMLLEYRETILNIDMLIIDELKDLFMMIY